ncbi:hypothetical protein IPL68_00345 [Candidatus Saccharibacteria bacterium]|nr:MAG: hypothetical protein IPL68_00345 [Candidatus Saccharibacteria bacterium]
MIKYKIFESDGKSEIGIIVGNVFGDTLDLPFGSEAHKSEQTNRAQQLALATGCTVLAFERPSTGHTRSIIPLGIRRMDRVDSFVSEAAMVAKELADISEKQMETKKILLIGASAAGSYAITMTHSQNIMPNGLGVFDPVGLIPLTRFAFAKTWLDHQLVEAARPAEHRNHNRAPAHGGARGVLTSADYIRRLIPEVAHNLGFWSSGIVGKQLIEIANDKRYESIRLHVTIPQHTFTHRDESPEQLASSGRLTFEQPPGTYHSWTDDAANFANFANRVLLSMQNS